MLIDISISPLEYEYFMSEKYCLPPITLADIVMFNAIGEREDRRIIK